MPTIGLLLILLSVLLFRQVIVGRAAQTPADFRDGLLAAFRGDFTALKTLSAARGTNVAPVGVAATSPAGAAFSGAQSPLEKEMRLLGTGKPYVFGAEGPNAYDCSGLVWDALRKLGLFNGARFVATTDSVEGSLGSLITRVGSQQSGAIVLWSGHHMGVCTGKDGLFSARSTTKGIGDSTISGDSSYFGFAPTYYQVNYAGVKPGTLPPLGAFLP